MVFQFYHLLPELTAFENVLTPALIAESTFGYWRRKKQYHQRAEELLELGGAHRPDEA